MDALKYNKSFKPRINTKMYIIPQLYWASRLFTFLLVIPLLFFIFYLFQYVYFQKTGQFYWIEESTSITRLVKHPYFWVFFTLDGFTILMFLFLKITVFEKLARWLCLFTFPIALYYMWEVSSGLPIHWMLLIIVGLCLNKDTSENMA